MSENLDDIILTSQPTLREELSQSIRNYPKTWREYLKSLAPAVAISAIGSAAGQWAATSLGYDSKLATTTAAYVCGYVPGFTTFFTMEYTRNREKYPRVFSKEFGEFVGTFLAADYVSDLSTFTPVFISSNLWMTDHTQIHPAMRSIIAWNVGALGYISAISALHPVARRLNQAINRGVKRIYKGITHKNHDTNTSS
jgi:hypothetical protein